MQPRGKGVGSKGSEGGDAEGDKAKARRGDTIGGGEVDTRPVALVPQVRGEASGVGVVPCDPTWPGGVEHLDVNQGVGPRPVEIDEDKNSIYLELDVPAEAAAATTATATPPTSRTRG